MGYRFIFAFIAAAVCFSAFADVYRWKDDEGNIIFSDTPQEGAEKIELKETTVVPALKPPRKTEVRSPAPARGYTSITITSPSHEQTLRNVQNVSVRVAVQPGLRDGDRVQLYVDGAAYGDPAVKTEFVIEQAERGEHQLAAAVLDNQGRELKRSENVVFYLHKESIRHPAPANPIAR